MSEISWGRKTKDAKRQQKLKRRVLLDTAAHEFTNKGYSETSINELAELLNVSKPALYYYVKNKEDILLQCTEISLELIMGIFTEVNQPEKVVGTGCATISGAMLGLAQATMAMP